MGDYGSLVKGTCVCDSGWDWKDLWAAGDRGEHLPPSLPSLCQPPPLLLSKKKQQLGPNHDHSSQGPGAILRAPPFHLQLRLQ